MKMARRARRKKAMLLLVATENILSSGSEAVVSFSGSVSAESGADVFLM